MYYILQFFLWLTIWMLVMALAEYSIHRWIMHRKRKWIPNWVFKEHSVEHHGKGRNDINIDLPMYLHLTVGSPLVLLSFYYGFLSFVTLMLVFMFHSYMWTKLHRAIHDLEDNWTKKIKYFYKFKLHHELHHKRTGKNFGVVFLFTDILFRTKLRR